MILRNFETLIAIAEQGSFAAAAEQAGLTQSAVSMQIKSLEGQLGVRLFDRSRRPPRLSEAGKSVIPFARRFLQDYASMRHRLGSGAEPGGRIRLGAVGSVLTGLVPRLLMDIREDHPLIRIELKSGFTSQLVTAVDNGLVDGAIVSDYSADHPHIDWQPFLVEPLVLVAPPDSQGTDLQRLIEHYPFIRYAPDQAVGKVIARALDATGLKITDEIQIDWIEAIEALVHRGLGTSILPDRRIAPSNQFALRRVPLTTSPRHRTLGLITRTDQSDERLIKLLLKALRAMSREAA
jgi:DNA-binding transcriptional LysR family regulator